MARREFSKATQRAALVRAEYRREAVTPGGDRCPRTVGRGSPVEFHHIVADTMGGEPTLANCSPLCPPCHRIETALLAAVTSRARRRADRHDGISDPHRRKLVSRGMPKAPKQRPATRPLEKWFGPGFPRPAAPNA